jgi:2-phosphoglycerate kinase
MKNSKLKLQSIFSSSFILGGSPCSGKSTIAERLSQDLDMTYYKVDDHIMHHLEKANPQEHPTMTAYAKMNWNEIWSRPVELQVAEEFRYYTEQFPMILEDLQAFKKKNSLIMEGAAFLPSLVHTWGIEPHQVLFMVPTKSFQIEHYSKRPWIDQILNECTDPQKAFANWMERDHLFGKEIIRQAQSLNYRNVIIDGSLSEDALYTKVKKHFRFV